MDLSDILSEGSVLYLAGIKTKEELLERISDGAATVLGQDRAGLLEALMNREALGSTALGSGIAIPHGKVAGLQQVRAIFARLEDPIEFEAVDDQPVDLVMALFAPLGGGADHLKALSRVARLLRTEAVVDNLRRTHDRNRLYAILTAPVAKAA